MSVNVRIDLEKVRTYNGLKQFLINQDGSSSDISTIATNLVGLHSARLISPYATLASRVRNFKHKQLTQQLFVERNLIKLRCMRKTLHTVPLDMAHIVHLATLDYRLSLAKGLIRKAGLSSKEVDKIKSRIFEILADDNKSSLEIEREIENGITISKHGIRAVIKLLWENGDLCYVNNSETWGKEVRVYALSSNFYPSLELNGYSRDNCVMNLVVKYLECYGPATEKDILWWSGLNKTDIRNVLEKLKKNLVELAIIGFSSPFYMLIKNFDELNNSCDVKLNNSIKLLAHEDPSLKGYFESRSRYVSRDIYHLLFNPIGEARSSITKNGNVIGLWTWDKRAQKIRTNLFTELKSQKLTELKVQVEEMELALMG